jgi:hypothetical protein
MALISQMFWNLILNHLASWPEMLKRRAILLSYCIAAETMVSGSTQVVLPYHQSLRTTPPKSLPAN